MARKKKDGQLAAPDVTPTQEQIDEAVAMAEATGDGLHSFEEPIALKEDKLEVTPLQKAAMAATEAPSGKEPDSAVVRAAAAPTALVVPSLNLPNGSNGPMDPSVGAQPAWQGRVNPMQPLTAEQQRFQNWYEKNVTPPAGVQESSAAAPVEEPAAKVGGIQGLYDQIAELERQRSELATKEQEALRNNKSRMRIAQVADALGAFANLYGVTKGGSNMSAPVATKYLTDAIINDSKLRNADMMRLNQSLTDAYRYLTSAENRAAAAQNTADRNEIYRQRESRLSNNAATKAQNAAERLAWDKEKFGSKQEFDRWRIGEQNRLKDKSLGIQQQNANSRAVSAQASATRADKYNGGGSGKVASADKEVAKAIAALSSNDNWPATRESLFRAATGKAWRDGSMTKDGEVWKELAEADTATKRKAVIEKLAAKYPEWAKANGIGTSGTQATTPSAANDDDNLPPSMRRQKEDENTPPSMRNK